MILVTIAQALFQQGQGKDQVNIPNVGTDTSIATIFQVALGIGGAIALIVVVIAGFQYTLSQGDPSKTAKAKNAIIYALIGLAVCAFAFSIVGFVVGEA